MEQNIGHELSWDSVIENDGSEFTLLPEGDYPFTVVKFERGRFGGSDKMPPCNMATLTLDVRDPATGASATVTENLMLHTRMEWKLCQFFVSIGQRAHGEQHKMDWTRVPGATGWCRLIVNKWVGKKDGREMENNRVDRFLAPDEAPAAAASQPPAAPAWKAGTF